MKLASPLRRMRLRAFLAASAASLLLAACGHSPPVQYYSLGRAAGEHSSPVSESGPSVVVGPVSIPAEVDRQQMVRIVDGVRLDVSSEHRWAAPLKMEVGRRVAGEIARRSGLERVVAWPQNAYADPDLSLPIDIQRLETSAFDVVSLDAVWSLRHGGREVAGGRVRLSERIDVPDHAGIARAHARIVDALASEIAARITVGGLRGVDARKY